MVKRGKRFYDRQAAAGTHYYYRIRTTDDFGTSPWSNIAEVTTPSDPGELPAPWQEQLVGAAGGSGDARFTNGVFSVTGSGPDIWGSYDNFFFVNQPSQNDVTITARITSMSSADSPPNPLQPWAKFGVMLRDTLDPGAMNALVFVSPQHGVGLQWRAATGGGSGYIGGGEFYFNSPLWLRLTRTGDTFAGYWSPDGRNWILIGQAQIAMASSVHAGMAVTSHQVGARVTGTFDNVTLSGGGGGAGPPAAPSNLAAVAVSANQINLSWTDNAMNDKAGVMIRESLAPGSANAFMIVTPGHGVGFQSRPVNGDVTTFVQGPASTSGWLRVTRVGNVFTGYTSNDGIHWGVVGSRTIPMGTTVLIGLAVTSHNNSVLNHSQFINVTIRN